MTLTLRSVSLVAAAGCAFALAGCMKGGTSDSGQQGATFCQNGSSCQGPIWFDANGDIINGSPADAASGRRSDGAQTYRNDGNYDQRRDHYQSQSGQSQSGASDGRDGWANVSEDAKILAILHAKNQKEIEIGRLAQSRGLSDEAKRFGEMLVKDHTDADAQVRSVAMSANITLMEPEEMHRRMKQEKGGMDGHSPKAADPAEELRNLQGSDFDRALGQKMEEGHRQLIEKVTAARGRVSNSQVRDLLDKMLPTLRHHEEMARSLASH